MRRHELRTLRENDAHKTIVCDTAGIESNGTRTGRRSMGGDNAQPMLSSFLDSHRSRTMEDKHSSSAMSVQAGGYLRLVLNLDIGVCGGVGSRDTSGHELDHTL